jgi:hypothetical protein
VVRSLPNPPSYLKEVDIPPETPGKSAFIVSKERGQALARANTIIKAARAAWAQMKKTYAKSFVPR